jgi:P27 family predicted phage terminase small subunit
VRGRKPKPAAVRDLEGGSAISHRPQAPEASVGAALDVVNGDTLPAPEYLPVEVVDVWNEIVPALIEVGLARSVDVPALEALTTHVAIARMAFDRLTKGGHLDVEAMVDYTDKGVPVVSPYHRIYRDSWRDALKLAEHYGLTPISRTRLGIAALQQRGLAEQLHAIMNDEGASPTGGVEIDGEVTDEAYFDAPVCLGCGVTKGRRHGPTCSRPGFSSSAALDPGEVVARKP